MDALVRPRSAGLLSQIRAGVSGAVQRLLGVGVQAYGKGGAPVSPAYDVDRSEAAFVSNPWVWACYHAISSDLSGLPLVAETGVGVNRVQTADHWLLALLESPHPKVSGRRFRKQLVADLLSGNAYVRVWRGPDGRPVQLGRIPPSVIRPVVADDGEEVGWSFTSGATLPWDQVLHISDLSLSGRPDLVMGSSPIQPLALGLSVDRDSRRQAGRAAKRGQLEMILSPNSEGMVLGEDRVRGIVDGYTRSREDGDGIYVVNTGMDAQPMTLTARDGEFLGIADRLRSEVLAVFGVPETRVGSPAANYGTAREQSRIYWQTLQARAALIDDELSRLAEPGVRIRHSFAGVDALQPGRTEQQSRAAVWVDKFGLEPGVAASYEGFPDLPAAAKKDATASSPFAQVGLPALVQAGIISRAAALKLLGLGPEDAPSPEELATLGGTAPTQSADPAGPPPSQADEPRRAAEAVVTGALRLVAQLYVDGTDAGSLRTLSVHLIRSTLAGLGAPNADEAAQVAATVCADAITASERAPYASGDLRAFGPEHAARIVRLSGLEVA